MKLLLKLCSILFVAVWSLALLVPAWAQPQIGGPYEPDSATVVLLHFDGNLINESDLSADAEAHGSLYYIPNNVAGLGQCLRIDNDSETDSSYVTVADTASLDLTGDWTLEGWINVFTFGEGSTDWRWVPRLFIKTGDEVFWRPNYFVEMWGNARMFSCGYHTADQTAWPQVNTPANTMEPGKWYHLTFIRDTSRHILVQAVHNANRELIVFAVEDYNTFEAPPDTPPITTSQPLFIGYAGGGNDSWLDGFVDEIRISNTVRQIAIPPAITNVTEMENQISSVSSYEIGAKIATLFGTDVQKATIHYSIGSTWSEVSMTEVATDSFAAAIPGQPVGTMIRYYISAEDEFGMRSLSPQEAESETPIYYSFGIYEPNTETLHISFEEGTGAALDHSSYGHTVTMVGNPVYSNETVRDNYCVYLEGDSSYLEVDSPFLHSNEMCVELWFAADTMVQYTRLVNRPIAADNWYQNNFEIRFQPNNTISAGSFIPAENVYTVNNLWIDSTLTIGAWYHVIYEVTDSTAIFELRDHNDQFIAQKSIVVKNPPVQATAPMRIGYAAGRALFEGKMDDIKVHNYASAGLISPVHPQRDFNIPKTVKLAQNYPNPFNPTTEIRFAIPNQDKVELVIYNLLGEKVKTLHNDMLAAGNYSIRWDATNEAGHSVASGVYFYELRYQNYNQVKKMLLLR